MKKYLKGFMCAVFTILTIFTFTGCAKKVNLEQAIAYIDSTSDVSGLENGFEVKTEDRHIIATFDNEENVTGMYNKEDNYEIWMNAEYLYVKITNNETVTKKKMRVDAVPEAYETYYNKKNNMAGYKNSGTKEYLKEMLSSYVEPCEENNIAYSLKKDKIFSTTKIKFSATDEDETLKATYKINYTYKNNKFVEYNFTVDYKNKTTGEKGQTNQTIKAFNGKISMPKDADDYQDVSVT